MTRRDNLVRSWLLTGMLGLVMMFAGANVLYAPLHRSIFHSFNRSWNMNRYFHVRFAMICMAFLLMAAVIAPSNAAAQNDNGCVCDYVTFRVDANVWCKVTVCVLSPTAPRNCVTMAPGDVAQLRCYPGSTIYIIDCHGDLIPIDPAAKCTRGIGAGPNCCTVDACFSPDTRCPTINITPSILDVCPCL